MATKRFNHVHKKRANRFIQADAATKRNRDLELARLEEELEAFSNIARDRALTLSEGTELNRLGIRTRRLRKKIARSQHIEPENVVPKRKH